MSLVIRFNLGEHWCFGRWQEREFWESWLFFLFFSFLDLGLRYTVVWVVQDSVSFTQWFVYSFSSEVGNSFTLTF